MSSSAITTTFTAAASTATKASVSSPTAAVDALFASAHCQRLLKLRHQDMDKMEIKTKTLAASMNHDQTRFTVYKLAIQSSVRRGAPSPSNTSDPNTGVWLLEKRYSEFAFFRRDVLQHLRAWEATLDHAQRKLPHCQPPAYALAVSALQQPLVNSKFPRKHMRCDTPEIVQQRRLGLEDFVRRLLDAYADFSVYLANNIMGQADEPANAQLQTLFLQLEAFLCVPDAQKEAERRQTDAILALVDVEEDDASSNKQDTDARQSCCICLEDDSAVATHSHSHSLQHEPQSNKLVQLPCRHQFHEDCIIDWFNASTTCPLCRRQAYRECPRVFDVTMRELTEL